jgi:adenylate kinase family enzyme
MTQIIVFEGTDFSGKSTIAKELAKRLGIPYYKNSAERVQKVQGKTLEMSRIVAPIVIDLLRQMDAKVILDRFIASEFVYAYVDKRPYDIEMLRELDHQLALLDTTTIICYKSTYVGYVDESTPEDRLPAILERYKEYAVWSEIQNIIFLDTTDCDTDRQISDLMKLLSEEKAPAIKLDAL